MKKVLSKLWSHQAGYWLLMALSLYVVVSIGLQGPMDVWDTYFICLMAFNFCLSAWMILKLTNRMQALNQEVRERIKFFQVLAFLTFGMAFLIVLPGVFLLAVGYGLLNVFEIESPLIAFLIQSSVFVYLSWISGVYASEVKIFSVFTKGFLSVSVLLCFLWAYYYGPYLYPSDEVYLWGLTGVIIIAGISGVKTGQNVLQNPSADSPTTALLQCALGVPLMVFTFVWLVLLSGAKWIL